MLKIILNPSVCPCLFLVILFQCLCKSVLIDFFHVLQEVCTAKKQDNVLPVIFFGTVFPQVVFCHTRQLAFAVDGTFPIADVGTV